VPASGQEKPSTFSIREEGEGGKDPSWPFHSLKVWGRVENRRFIPVPRARGGIIYHLSKEKRGERNPFFKRPMGGGGGGGRREPLRWLVQEVNHFCRERRRKCSFSVVLERGEREEKKNRTTFPIVSGKAALTILPSREERKDG